MGRVSRTLVVVLAGAVIACGCKASPINVSRFRDVCSLPRPGNNGRVLGHDVGESISYHGSVYWFFGDTRVDADGDGIPQPLAIVPGTIAKTTDTNAKNCIDLTYKTDGSGIATAALPPSRGEKTTWPAGPVVANDNLYWVYQGIAPDGTTLRTGLAKLTNETTMDATRVASYNIAPGTTPITAGGYVYFFRLWAAPQPVDPNPNDTITPLDGTSKVFITRVLEASIEQPSAYRYWAGGQTWSTNVDQSVALFTEGGPYTVDSSTTPPTVHGNLAGVSGAISVSFNSYLNRWLAVYSCDAFAGAVCARTTDQVGSSPSALTGVWDDPKQLMSCQDNAFCVHAAQHPAYFDSLHPARIFITNARDFGDNDRYWITLHEIDISSVAPPGNREFHNAEGEFSSTQNGAHWSYWARNADGSAINQLTWNTSQKKWVDPQFGAVSIERDSQTPGTGKDALRIWSAPAAGTVEISGEARLDGTCGDGVDVEIYMLHVATSTSQSLWSTSLSGSWGPTHGAIFDLKNVAVGANDQLKFRVGHGPATTACDRTYFKPTLVFDRT